MTPLQRAMNEHSVTAVINVLVLNLAASSYVIIYTTSGQRPVGRAV